MSDLLDLPVSTLSGERTTVRALAGARATLVVNVASRCGLTPQYTKLEALQTELSGRGFTVLGFPCNQFAGQEPGTAEQIQQFCSATYGVTFPLSAKVDVNGENRDPVYDLLTRSPDPEGEAGDVQWNFEKFLLDGGGDVVARFRPRTEPDDERVRAAIGALLA